MIWFVMPPSSGVTKLKSGSSPGGSLLDATAAKGRAKRLGDAELSRAA